MSGPETGLRLAERGRAALSAPGAQERAFERFDWFYLGAEFCENLLPSPAWYASEASFFLGRGAKVCLLTPQVSDAGAARLRPVFRRLAALARRFPGRVEVTVNDLGALRLALDSGLEAPLAAGRLLYENAFFMQKNYLRAINAEALRFFAGFGVRRFEFSATGALQGTNFPEAKAFGFDPSSFSLTLHYPYLNLTSSRACAAGLPDIGPGDSVSRIACRRECQAASFRASHPLVNEPLLVRGNTVFMEFPEKFYKSPAALQRRRIDRLVYSPFL